jgi:hypothetical protein
MSVNSSSYAQIYPFLREFIPDAIYGLSHLFHASQQAYEVISGDDNCSADDPAGQGFQDTSLIENGYSRLQNRCILVKALPRSNCETYSTEYYIF